jgi:hypothetical protein
LREQDRRRVERQAATLRRDAAALEELLAVEVQLRAREVELADARAYANRLEFVLAIGDIGACLGAAGDRCHHGHAAHDAVGIPVPQQARPPLIEVIGKRAERKAARKRDARRDAREHPVTEDP